MDYDILGSEYHPEEERAKWWREEEKVG